MQAILNHLWQSTVFAGVAWLLTLALKRNRAQTRYWVWFAASMKFLAPLALLVAVGSQVSWRHETAVSAPAWLPVVMEQVGQPFEPATPATPKVDLTPELLLLIWAAGFVAIGIKWGHRWTQMNADARKARPMEMGLPVPVRASAVLREPGVFGGLRPILLLPEGIAERLTPAQLNAILAHEMCHVRRRDNLATAMHMVVEAVFWFHPLVWWIGARLMEERERACDEEVLRTGNDAQTYAEGILKVCEFYLKWPLECVAGVSGANLSKRIEDIMTSRTVFKLNAGRKLLLAGAGVVAVAGPIAIGIVNAPPIRAQVQAASPLAFEVASVRLAPPVGGGLTVSMLGGPGSPDPGQITYTNVTLKQVLGDAYGMNNLDRITAPGWADSQRYNIIAKIPEGATKQQFNLMLQNLLAERFKLTLHHETRDFASYELVMGKKGPKLKESVESAAIAQGAVSGTFAFDGSIPLDKNGFPRLSGDGPSTVAVSVDGRMRTAARGQTLAGITRMLANSLRSTVVDKTGLKGKYDFTLDFDPAPSEIESSISTAVEEQLGLRLVASKEAADVLVIDHVEKVPAEN